MGKLGSVAAYECSECGWRTPKWAGRCGECQEWGSLVQAPPAGLATATAGSTRVPLRAGTPRTAAVPIGQVDAAAARARPTGMDELDRVLGGGLVPGAVVLLAGEPGVGKSTLLLEAGALAAKSGPVLYVTGEESAAQVRQRADRVGAISDNLFLAAETDFAALLAHVEAVDPTLLIVDSVQTISAAGLDGVPGGVTQVREITAALTTLAKQRTLTTVLVGHVTKDGSVAGPRTLEHLVDVVLSFDGDSRGQLRMVRALKNRFGPTDEIGCFELGEDGLTGLADPSGLFLSQRHDPVPGTCVTVTLEGRRPLVAEVQTLVCSAGGELARRVTSGLDSSRVGMVLAVLQRRAGISIGRQDVYAATVGGVRLTEPSVDLALALALASARSEMSVPGDLVAIGEVGLAGEIRRVSGVTRRLAEAQRLGFRRAIVPPGSGYATPGSAAAGPTAIAGAPAGSPAAGSPPAGSPPSGGPAAGSPPAGGPAAGGPAAGGPARGGSADGGREGNGREGNGREGSSRERRSGVTGATVTRIRPISAELRGLGVNSTGVNSTALFGTRPGGTGMFGTGMPDTEIPVPWASRIAVAGGEIDVREAPDIRTALVLALGG